MNNTALRALNDKAKYKAGDVVQSYGKGEDSE